MREAPGWRHESRAAESAPVSAPVSARERQVERWDGRMSGPTHRGGQGTRERESGSAGLRKYFPAVSGPEARAKRAPAEATGAEAGGAGAWGRHREVELAYVGFSCDPVVFRDSDSTRHKVARHVPEGDECGGERNCLLREGIAKYSLCLKFINVYDFCKDVQCPLRKEGAEHPGIPWVTTGRSLE
ncbi:MAG: hypothetical protein FD180_2280 [Planctomycetota bacterium]|nr:MAG: hypothetical protein FD180_2280 [Planctomycetota bacterium]